MPVKEIRFKPIGFVRRASKQEDVKDRSLVSRIIIRKELTKAMKGVEDFSHLFILFYMHEVPEKETKTMKVHPRGRADLPLVGIFATRTAFRPNPIGLTVVELLKREENILTVRGLDALDGTPVLDIKAYDSRDVIANVKVPEWHRRLNNE